MKFTALLEQCSKEHRKILRQQHTLVQDDLSPCDFPLAVRLSNHVGALADEEVAQLEQFEPYFCFFRDVGLYGIIGLRCA
jgi:hypothetical protein